MVRIRRALDKRPFLILSEGGLSLMTHGYAGNLAHAVLLAVDKPEVAAGQIYNCGDDIQFSVRQIVDIIADEIGNNRGIASPTRSHAESAR